jgi:hypothetical protein
MRNVAPIRQYFEILDHGDRESRALAPPRKNSNGGRGFVAEPGAACFGGNSAAMVVGSYVVWSGGSGFRARTG